MACAKAQSGDSKATGSRQSHRKTAYLAWGKSFYCKNHAEHHDLNSSNISTFLLWLKSFLFLFEIQSRNPF